MRTATDYKAWSLWNAEDAVSAGSENTFTLELPSEIEEEEEEEEEED